MTDYSERVKALRCENTGDDECGSSDCPYWSGLGCMDGQLMEDAAAAIEELQAVNKELQERIEDKMLQVDFLTADCTNYESAIEALQAEVKKKRTANCWGCKCEKLEVQE